MPMENQKSLQEILLLYRYPAYFQVRVLFLGRECFESLPESERQQIYDLHQQDLMERSG